MSVDPRYIPYYPYVTNKGPTEADKALDKTLKAFMDDPRSQMQIENDEEMEHRSRVLLRVQQLFKNFVKNVAINVCKMTEEDAEDAGGDLLVSGSHRLGVRDIKADIDTICVAPNFITRVHFFTILKDELSNHPDVADFTSIETAAVPIMSFDFEGVSIDLLFARLAENIVPKNLNEYVLDDHILIGIDEATEKSLNGPRVTNMIPLLANKAKDIDGRIIDHEAYPMHSTNEQLIENKFLVVLRCVRKWAKARGLYGNKMGYLGGINCNLLVAMVCQRYPNASPSNLLARFFFVYSKWPWPSPVMLNAIQPHPPFFGESDKGQVWNAEEAYNQFMPIITPAYPAMNSALSVSSHTLGVMKAELTLAYDVCRAITTSLKTEGHFAWSRLFRPSDFFIQYNHYLILNIIAVNNDPESRGWVGFVESRIRSFTSMIEQQAIIHPIHLYPKGSKTQKSANSLCYFIGFNIDTQKLRADKTLDLQSAIARFKKNGVNGLFDKFNGGRGVSEGLDFTVEHVTWSKLPKEVWDYLGGKENARARRAELGYGKKVDVVATAATNAPATAAVESVVAESKETEPVAEPAQNDVKLSKKRKHGDERKVALFDGLASVGTKRAETADCWPEEGINRFLVGNGGSQLSRYFSMRPSEVTWN